MEVSVGNIFDDLREGSQCHRYKFVMLLEHFFEERVTRN